MPTPADIPDAMPGADRRAMRPVNGDAFRGMCAYRFWHNAEPRENPAFASGEAVFCKIDEVWRLFRALRRTRRRVVVVTHEGDKPVTPALWGERPPHVEAWFGCNMFAEHEDAHPVPLGLGNSDGHVTLSWGEICAAPRIERAGLLYANFSAASNPGVRRPLLDWLAGPERAWVTREAHAVVDGRASYLHNLRSHHFVYCPPGNGEDTHRMWEALYCGAIPVARESPTMRAFRALPIHFVPDLAAITEDGLRATLAQWSARPHSLEMLDAGFWERRLEAAVARAREKGPLTPLGWLAGWGREVLRVAAKTLRGK